jgi:hypothetical protein
MVCLRSGSSQSLGLCIADPGRCSGLLELRLGRIWLLEWLSLLGSESERRIPQCRANSLHHLYSANLQRVRAVHAPGKPSLVII